MSSATDIVLLTHNRLDHLVKTIDALEHRTHVPFRLTVVDNASGPEVRNWLASNRNRFERVIPRPTNEHVPAFQYGIDATSSDPYVVADPDLVVPDLDPCWLERLLDMMRRHPDFGLIGLGLDPVNRPPVLPPEQIDSAHLVDDEIVEEPVGTWFQTIRRNAFHGPYYSDSRTCLDIRRAGYRVGWTPAVRAFHLGWDDLRLYPEHLVAKDERGAYYPQYAEVGLLDRPPTLLELAAAAPVLAESRARGIPDSALLEVTWSSPAVAAALPGPVAIAGPVDVRIPLADDAAAAVVLMEPPPDRAFALVEEACRVATKLVIAVASLAAFDGVLPSDVAPSGWRGSEAPAVGEAALVLARHGDRTAAEALTLYETLGRREQWLTLFERARFGAADPRLFLFEAEEGGSPRDDVSLDPDVEGLRPAARPLHPSRLRKLGRRVPDWFQARRSGV